MTSQRQPPDDAADAEPTPLQELLSSLPEGSAAAQRLLAEIADVQVAHEELRVAEEEMRTQQQQITELLLRYDTERRWRGQMSALVPIGLCLTDGNGTLVEANPALVTHLGSSPHRLRGKPLSVFLSPADVPAFRTALRELTSGTATEMRLSVAVHPRHLPPGKAHLFGFTETADHRPSVARVQWVLVPEDLGHDGAQSPPPTSGRGPAATEGPRAVEIEQPIPASEVIGLATALAELSALPVGEEDQQRLLGRMATLVRGAVPGADWVSITLGSPMEPQRQGTDSVEAQDFDGRQVRADEGPCWDAYRKSVVVLTDDITRDPRWPALAVLAGDAPVRSVLAVPVPEDNTTIGAVNVYSGTVGAFGTAGRRIAELATAAVAGVLQNVTEREAMQALATNLERALSSRAVIDQAKGVIMAHQGVNADEAFARLVKVSSRLNVKVRDLAGLIVEGHVESVLRAAD